MDREELDDNDRKDEKRDDGSLEHVFANSNRDNSERELFKDAILATCVEHLASVNAVVEWTHSLLLQILLAVFPVEKLEVPGGEHVEDDGDFGEEHDGKGDDVEQSGRYHLAGRRAVQRARLLSFCEWRRRCV